MAKGSLKKTSLCSCLRKADSGSFSHKRKETIINETTYTATCYTGTINETTYTAICYTGTINETTYTAICYTGTINETTYTATCYTGTIVHSNTKLWKTKF